jgi:hypothetical protein
MKKTLFFCIIILLLFSNCNKENGLIKKESISGLVQKGPFINGTSITFYELDRTLSQTGKSYNTQIINNQGSFELQNIELISSYISLRADGFYFNEILDKQSNSQITLYAISDITDKSTINVNILSHLEKARVEYLISQGSVFSDAKIQAQNEVLNIFGFSLTENQPFELLDLSQSGENNAILLASSLILQGLRSEGELTELLSNISSDLREDGVLNNSILGSQLINHALYLKTSYIRENLERRYAELGILASIPGFEEYIEQFIDNTNFEVTESLIDYPENGLYGPNILDLNKTIYTGSNWSYFSLSANMAKETKLKIKITALSAATWGYVFGSNKNWSVSLYDPVTNSQYFTSTAFGENCDLTMVFEFGDFLIEYFEMNSTEPTRTKTITRR